VDQEQVDQQQLKEQAQEEVLGKAAFFSLFF